MSQISAKAVKELRDKTGAGMMDCKNALAETGGDVEAAFDWLRKKGLAKAAKKSGRTAADGLVAVASSGPQTAAVVEVNAETDFVARNDDFQAVVGEIAQLAAEGEGSVEALTAATLASTGKTVNDSLTDLVARIGENMTLRRVAKLSVGKGVVASYIHNALKPGMGKIGVIVALESDGDQAVLEQLGRNLAMHVAAARPEALSVDDLDPASVEREKSVLADQARASGKPDEIIEKMVQGRLRKFYEEVVLLEQTFVIDGESKVRAVVEGASKEAGAPVALSGFARFELGEGIETEETDFAAEVAATLSS